MVDGGKVTMLVLVSDCGIRRANCIKEKTILALATPVPHGLG